LTPMTADFDTENSGLLDGLEGRARTDRAELITWLLAHGFSVEQIRTSTSPMLLPAQRVMGDDGVYLSAREAAAATGLDLVDVTYSGATTAHVLTDSQHGTPPQAGALDGSESLVTITIGGNDVGYVPLLLAACLPRPVRLLPRLRELLDPGAAERALSGVGDSLLELGRVVTERAPSARVLFVDYLTLLPPPGQPAPPMSRADADLGRHVAATLERVTAEAAAATGCGVVKAGEASRAHHGWSSDPWTTRFSMRWPGRPAPLHPNAAGMRAVAGLVEAKL